MTNKILTVLLGGLLVLNSCSKKGDTGATGPTGATGNANVVGTGAFTISLWTATGTGPSDSSWTATYSVPDVTQDVVDKGLVEVYKFYSPGTWAALPEHVGNNATGYDFKLGYVEIYNRNEDGSLPATTPGTVTFRVVVIPASQRMAHPNTNWNNYTEAMNALNSTASAASVK